MRAKRILNVPFFVILMGLGAVSMLLPAIHAWTISDWSTGRSFLYSALIFLLLSVLIGFATYNSQSTDLKRSHLFALPAFFVVLPLMLAVPFNEAVKDTTYYNSYFEMVSSLTTTGATLFEDPLRLAPSVHLWRALVGWMGGLFIWITAAAILAPLNLGGFEVLSPGQIGSGARSGQAQAFYVRVTDPRERLLKFAVAMTPIYAALTLALWVALIIAGEAPFVALCHAMSTLATSGISPIGGLDSAASGVFGEALIFLFFIFALTRNSFSSETRTKDWWRFGRDPELTMAIICVVVVPALLFLRHWVGAYDVDDQQNLRAAVLALWGSIFSVLSFLSTTGFVSVDWVDARAWSGLQSPGMILLGLALTGGGVATTAGGVKLLRVFALYQHGLRELQKLAHPNSVGGSGRQMRHLRRQGAYVAWIFFMLFALSIALVMAAFSLTGLDFEACTIFAVAALSTTGPLVQVAGETALSISALTDAGKAIFTAAMVLGRLETLAVIALLNPEFWRT